MDNCGSIKELGENAWNVLLTEEFPEGLDEYVKLLTEAGIDPAEEDLFSIYCNLWEDDRIAAQRFWGAYGQKIIARGVDHQTLNIPVVGDPELFRDLLAKGMPLEGLAEAFFIDFMLGLETTEWWFMHMGHIPNYAPVWLGLYPEQTPLALVERSITQPRHQELIDRLIFENEISSDHWLFVTLEELEVTPVNSLIPSTSDLSLFEPPRFVCRL